MARVPRVLNQGQRAQLKSEQGMMLLGVDLRDAREEIFVRMVCDGVSLGVAFIRAGFKSANVAAASNLWQLSRIQERAKAIMEARATTGVVTLPQVTDMLQRVFSGAYSEGEYSAAHNAAFSLARLYGHVTDRASFEVIRRPSRDPDAPSEQALSSWVEALPGLEAPANEASFLRVSDAPAAPLEQAPPQSPNDINGLTHSSPVDWTRATARPEGPGPEFSNDFKGLAGPEARGRPENGAPSRPVTGTPDGGARSGLLAPCGECHLTPGETCDICGRVAPGGSEKGAPLQNRQVPGTPAGKFPKWEDLF